VFIWIVFNFLSGEVVTFAAFLFKITIKTSVVRKRLQ